MIDYKQVILVRADLKLPKGKLGAQVAHASVAVVLKSDKKVVNAWVREGMAKIVVKIADVKELRKYLDICHSYGLKYSVITDAGRTVVAPGTITCAAIGPDLVEKIDKVTGTLTLL